MKIASLSDAHGNKGFSNLVSPCDVLTICGDISPMKDKHTFESQKHWFENSFIKKLEYLASIAEHVIFIGGNHDRFLYECLRKGQTDSLIKSQLPPNVHYLCNDTIIIDGVKFYGNPWCNAPNWADFNSSVWSFASRNQEFLSAIYKDIPDDVDVILTHGPAYGYADQILDESILDYAFETYKDRLKAEHLGCKALAHRVKQIATNREKNLYLFSGHIHSADHDLINDYNLYYAGVSILNEEYELGNYKPLEINL